MYMALALVCIYISQLASHSKVVCVCMYTSTCMYTCICNRQTDMYTNAKARMYVSFIYSRKHANAIPIDTSAETAKL